MFSFSMNRFRNQSLQFPADQTIKSIPSRILMKIAFIYVLTFLGLAPSISSATIFTIDPVRSYISVPVPTWEQGEPWWFIKPDGNELGGYQWTLTSQNKQFDISGKLNLSRSNSPLSNWLLNIDSLGVISSAPDLLGFSIPSILSLDPSSGLLQREHCPFFSWCREDPFISITGFLTGDSLILNGAFNSTQTGLSETLGGLTPPYQPEFSYANAPYTYHIEALVPEPDSSLLLLSGGLALLLTNLGRNRKKSAIEVLPRCSQFISCQD